MMPLMAQRAELVKGSEGIPGLRFRARPRALRDHRRGLDVRRHARVCHLVRPRAFARGSTSPSS
eukprot:4303922-Heterocapsa_arctica.AAC.1